MKEVTEKIQGVKEQIQKDILAYIGERHESAVWLDGDDLCKIVVDNFKRLEG